MEWFRSWLLGVVAAALAVALAQALTPEGTVKKVGKLVGGLVLLLAVARPILQLDPGDLAVTASAYAALDPQAAAQGGEDVMKTLIAQKAGAYIVDKAAQLGCVCTAAVEVETGEAGWPVPWSAQVQGSWTAEQKNQLSKALDQELDIPADRQSFKEDVE